jgi:hypothetical protein
MPFLHVPTFLKVSSLTPHICRCSYARPGLPGSSEVGRPSLCSLCSRGLLPYFVHIGDPRVRASPDDGVSSGTMWFDLFNRLRTLPGGYCPTLYTIQATLVAGIYAIGWGKPSKAFALISESVTLSLDAGLHRSTDAYDIFDAFGPL